MIEKKRSLGDWRSTAEVVLAHTTSEIRRALAGDLLDACDRVAELEAEVIERKLPKVWTMEIAGREIVLRVENGRMSAVATILGNDDEMEAFRLRQSGVERIQGWPEHPEPKEGGA